jgi:hypothetical protein
MDPRIYRKWETNHSAYGPVIMCNRKQGYYSDCRIRKMMTLNNIHYNSATSTFFNSWPLFEKFSYAKKCTCVWNQLGDKHQKQLKVVYYYIEKESRRSQSHNHQVWHIVTASYLFRLFNLSRKRDMNSILYTRSYLSCNYKSLYCRRCNSCNHTK